MSEEHPQLTLKPSDALREIIEKAVERETFHTVSPLRDRVLTNEGYQRENTKNIASLLDRVDELEAIVRGDSALGVAGLVVTVNSLSTSVNALVKRIDDRDRKEQEDRQRIQNYLKAGRWVAGVLITLGVLDNETLRQLVVQFIEALQ